jgi:hypothetical protein
MSAYANMSDAELLAAHKAMKDPFGAALEKEGVLGSLADIARSIYQQESGGGRNTKTSNAGAVGGMQILPSTFKSVAESNWDINNPEQNIRAGIRYLKQLNEKSGGDAALTAAGYYGGPGGMEKARQGIAVSDPRNPNAPNTLEYGKQVVARLPKTPSPEKPAQNPYESMSDADLMAQYEKVKPTPQTLHNVTDDMSTFQKFAAGLGKSMVDTGRGVGQLMGLVSQQEIDESAKTDKALMGTTAGLIGNVGGQVAQMAIPGAGAAKGLQMAGLGGKLLAGGAIARAAAGGASFAASQPVLTGNSRAENAAIGGLAGGAGQGAVSGLQALAKPAAAAMSPAVSQLAAKAEAMGIPISAAQLSDSKFVKTLASVLEKLPFTGAGNTRTAQQQSFNQAVSKTFGEDAPAITQQVYSNAKSRIGGEFERLSSQNSLNVSDGLLNKLVTLQDEAQRFGSNDTARAVASAIDELLSKADKSGVVPGKAYQSLDSKLGKMTKTGDEKAMYLAQVRDAVRSSMDDSISKPDQAAWKLAREQYKNLKTIRDLVAKEGADGNISPALLAGRMNSSPAGKEAMAMGRGGEMGDLARIGQQFLKDKIPDSGTAGRLAAMGAMGGGGYALGIDPKTLLLTAAGGATAGRGLNILLNSGAGRNFMLNGSQNANQLARLMSPAPYVATPLALEAAR